MELKFTDFSYSVGFLVNKISNTDKTLSSSMTSSPVSLGKYLSITVSLIILLTWCNPAIFLLITPETFKAVLMAGPAAFKTTKSKAGWAVCPSSNSYWSLNKRVAALLM